MFTFYARFGFEVVKNFKEIFQLNKWKLLSSWGFLLSCMTCVLAFFFFLTPTLPASEDFWWNLTWPTLVLLFGVGLVLPFLKFFTKPTELFQKISPQTYKWLAWKNTPNFDNSMAYNFFNSLIKGYGFKSLYLVEKTFAGDFDAYHTSLSASQIQVPANEVRQAFGRTSVVRMPTLPHSQEILSTNGWGWLMIVLTVLVMVIVVNYLWNASLQNPLFLVVLGLLVLGGGIFAVVRLLKTRWFYPALVLVGCLFAVTAYFGVTSQKPRQIMMSVTVVSAEAASDVVVPSLDPQVIAMGTNQAVENIRDVAKKVETTSQQFFITTALTITNELMSDGGKGGVGTWSVLYYGDGVGNGMETRDQVVQDWWNSGYQGTDGTHYSGSFSLQLADALAHGGVDPNKAPDFLDAGQALSAISATQLKLMYTFMTVTTDTLAVDFSRAYALESLLNDSVREFNDLSQRLNLGISLTEVHVSEVFKNAWDPTMVINYITATPRPRATMPNVVATFADIQKKAQATSTPVPTSTQQPTQVPVQSTPYPTFEPCVFYGTCTTPDPYVAQGLEQIAQAQAAVGVTDPYEICSVPKDLHLGEQFFLKELYVPARWQTWKEVSVDPVGESSIPFQWFKCANGGGYGLGYQPVSGFLMTWTVLVEPPPSGLRSIFYQTDLVELLK